MPESSESASPRSVSERAVVLLIGAVQFVNILDFVMVMPLGPDFAKGLGIESSHIGTIGGSYTAAASVAGLLGGYFLDRFDRRKALAVCMLGLVAATAAGGLALGCPRCCWRACARASSAGRRRRCRCPSSRTSSRWSAGAGRWAR
ncbi:MFS transporter [Corallococcus sp. 4LFB]|uniref:MFS transporter n=1 Tax=Corallococcus sp. 4LFB TaxID=3383249 RepID=UPI003976B316